MPGRGDPGCVPRARTGAGGAHLLEETHLRLRQLPGDTGAIGEDGTRGSRSGRCGHWGAQNTRQGQYTADLRTSGELRVRALRCNRPRGACANAQAKSGREMGGAGGSDRRGTGGVAQRQRATRAECANSSAGAGGGESRGSQKPGTSGGDEERTSATENTEWEGEQDAKAGIEREAAIRGACGSKPRASIQGAYGEDGAPGQRRKWPDG